MAGYRCPFDCSIPHPDASPVQPLGGAFNAGTGQLTLTFTGALQPGTIDGDSLFVVRTGRRYSAPTLTAAGNVLTGTLADQGIEVLAAGVWYTPPPASLIGADLQPVRPFGPFPVV